MVIRDGSYGWSMPGVGGEQYGLLTVVKDIRRSNMKVITREVLKELMLFMMSNPEFLKEN